MVPFLLYNSLTRSLQPFTPSDPTCISLYVCGPTVYDHPHIGNARCYVVFDILFRVLKFLYPKVVYVRNITDVDDKIIAAALLKNTSILEITEKTIQYFHRDMGTIFNLPPTHEPRATDYISEMIRLIQILITQNTAYYKDGHVLFRTKSFKSYGTLSHKNLDDLISGARIEVESYKEDPCDFVLWKTVSESEGMGWESPFGYGRPGWHIECSAMSGAYLPIPFDIHGGGIDLIFPHHENEQAQTCGAYHQDKTAHFWLHNGHLMVEGKKMSKSLGNFITVQDLIKTIHGEVIRFALLLTHYRHPLDWKRESTLQNAKIQLDRLYTALSDFSEMDGSYDPQVLCLESMNALYSDLNTPGVIQALLKIARMIHTEKDIGIRTGHQKRLYQTGRFLGFFNETPAQWFQNLQTYHTLSPTQIESMIETRHTLRRDKNFKAADDIRKQLKDQGVDLIDLGQTTTWKLK